MADTDAQENTGDPGLTMEFYEQYRGTLFAQIAAIEQHQLHLDITTSDRLLWLKHRGPPDHIIARQVAHIRACR